MLDFKVAALFAHGRLEHVGVEPRANLKAAPEGYCVSHTTVKRTTTVCERACREGNN